jgi:chromatin remodeling complex protein RSC6
MENSNAEFKIFTISKLVMQGKMENGTINTESLKKLKKGTYLIKVEGEEMTYLFND